MLPIALLLTITPILAIDINVNLYSEYINDTYGFETYQPEEYVCYSIPTYWSELSLPEHTSIQFWTNENCEGTIIYGITQGGTYNSTYGPMHKLDDECISFKVHELIVTPPNADSDRSKKHHYSKTSGY